MSLFKLKTRNFALVVGLDSSHIPYHIKPYQTKSNKTKPYQIKPNITIIAITQSIFKLEARNFAS